MAAIGLILLVVAGIVALAGGLANSGSDHTVVDFALLGFDVEGSSGRVFIYGAVLGAIATLGLNMLLAGLGKGFKNRVKTRRELKHEHKERERLEKELEAERANRGEAIDIDSPPTRQ